jgi:hypothetical protein
MARTETPGAQDDAPLFGFCTLPLLPVANLAWSIYKVGSLMLKPNGDYVFLVSSAIDDHSKLSYNHLVI